MSKDKAEVATSLVVYPDRAALRSDGGMSVTSRKTVFERSLLCWLLEALGNPPIRFVLWNGDEVFTNADRPVARIIIHDRPTLLRLVINPELHFGDCYSEGGLEVEGNIVDFLEAIYRSMAKAGPHGFLRRQLVKWHARPQPATLAHARDNIHHHYDIGNEFYALWLDSQMVYTCAYFNTPFASLEQAQTAKMEHICRKLRLQPGMTVVEAGCGWGTLSHYMARNFGVSVRAYNISHQQILYARKRAREQGLQGKVEFIEDDYRNISGQHDAFVSVGMLEHVGAEQFPTFSRVIDRSLNANGRGLLHFIGRNRPAPMNAWVAKRIFPGAYPPALREVMGILEPSDLTVLDVENLRPHYARTLQHWLWRYEKVTDKVRYMFDEEFVRSWRLYLAGSIAAFSAGDLQLFQVSFARDTAGDMPWTRDYLLERRTL